MKSQRVKYLLFIGIIFLLTYTNLDSYSQVNEINLVWFKDKPKGDFSLKNPEKYLSYKAIERRRKNNIAITENDIPVYKPYLDSLRIKGAVVINTSKWLNTATIYLKDGFSIDNLKTLTFISNIQKTRDGFSRKISNKRSKLENEFIEDSTSYSISDYGESYRQIEIENGQYLHKLGYKGKGIRIAILDAGFLDANNYISLTKLRDDGRVLTTRDFVYPTQNIYQAHTHGAWVLSTIASELNGTITGTAPEAMFHLLRTEDANSEYPVEEDNWVAGAEYADSAGVDIINTSLGYTTFDNPMFSYTYSSMDGSTTRISRAAEIAATKGIVVVVSAGNEGNDTWHYISAPADARDVITAGALNSSKIKATFSSFGPSSDGRVKPDVMAMGEKIFAETAPGIYGYANGTSFSAPITTGIIACLMQAFPAAKTSEIRDAVRGSASFFSNPNPSYGYGIPDFEKAYLQLKEKYNGSSLNETIYPNPFSNILRFYTSFTDTENLKIECFSSTGIKLFETQLIGASLFLTSEIKNLPQGFYIFRVSSGNKNILLNGIKVIP
jgi:subtilisin family serine protease